jgi:hypothetical protein
MRQPSNYDTTQAADGSGGAKLTVGGKICIITGAYESVAKKSGMPMLVIEFDICEGAEKNHYKDLQEKFGGDWRGVYRQPTQDVDGNCSPFFKGVITAIEASNDRYKFDFNERTLIGKRFGGIFGEEEYLSRDGEVKSSVKLAYIRSVESIRKGEFKVPAKKTVVQTGAMSTAGSGFTDIKPEDIPF